MYTLQFLSGDHPVVTRQVQITPEVDHLLEQMEVFLLPENQTEDPKVFRVAKSEAEEWRNSVTESLHHDFDVLLQDYIDTGAIKFECPDLTLATGRGQLLSGMDLRTDWDTLSITIQ